LRWPPAWHHDVALDLPGWGKPEITLALINAGADVNVAESDGDTALWIATTESSLEVMEALLKKGADPNVQAQGKIACPSVTGMAALLV
jgi:ankyrin repeat protein